MARDESCWPLQALLDRVVNCVSSGEQSKALQELSALMATDPGARVSLGGIGFQHLLNIVRTERDDVRCLCLALEVMLAAVSAFSGALRAAPRPALCLSKPGVQTYQEMSNSLHCVPQTPSTSRPAKTAASWPRLPSATPPS